MEYRNIEYSVFQDTGLGTWKWTVNVSESTVESGTSKTREAALSAVVLTIDRWKARAPKICMISVQNRSVPATMNG